MPPPEQTSANYGRNPTLRAIAVKERREILNAILSWGPVTEKSLAGYIAAQLHRTPSPTDEQIHSAHVELVHCHLPLLTDAGLSKWDAESETVDTTTHSALSDQRFLHLLRLDSEGVDDVLDALSHEYRRITLTALWEGETEQTVTTLARNISHYRDQGDPQETVPVEEIVTTLHHIHLPKLVGYDHIEYDPETSRVMYTGYPALEEVLSIIYESDSHLVGKLDGFLSGLQDSPRPANSNRDAPAGWPHHWRQNHG